MEINKESVIEYLSKLPVIEMANLVKELEEKWGVSASAAVQAVAAAPDAGAEEEKTDFNVVLVGVGGNKIAVIKEVRALTNLGLKQAKELVDGAPKVVKEGIPKEEAEKIKGALEKAGASVELK